MRAAFITLGRRTQLPVKVCRQAGEKVWLLQKSAAKCTKQQLTMGKIRQVPSTAWSSALIRRRFATKRYTQDQDIGEEDAFAGKEGDDDELKETVFYARLLEDVQSTKCPRMSYFVHVLTRRGIFSRAASISLSTSNCEAFI